jgi:hypothetical protein
VGARGLLVCDQRGAEPLVILERFSMKSSAGPCEGESGRALWCRSELESGSRIAGHWRVQCIDESAVGAEHSLFSAEDDLLQISPRHAVRNSRYRPSVRTERSNRLHTARAQGHHAS